MSAPTRGRRREGDRGGEGRGGGGRTLDRALSPPPSPFPSLSGCPCGARLAGLARVEGEGKVSVEVEGGGLQRCACRLFELELLRRLH